MTTQTNHSKETNPESRGPKTPWVLLLPLALFAGAIWQKTRAPETPLDTANMTGGVTKNAVKPARTEEEKSKHTIFFSNENGYLSKTTIETHSGSDEKTAQRVVELMLQKYPQDFPQGTKILGPAKIENNVVTLDFNRAFTDNSFWQGSTRVLTTIYSIVNTVSGLTEESTGRSSRVQFLVEGKPIETLGDFEANEPFSPDMTMVRSG